MQSESFCVFCVVALHYQYVFAEHGQQPSVELLYIVTFLVITSSSSSEILTTGFLIGPCIECFK